MNAPAYSLDIEAVDHGSPERALWCAALSLFLDDARRYHQGKVDTFGAGGGEQWNSKRT